MENTNRVIINIIANAICFVVKFNDQDFIEKTVTHIQRFIQLQKINACHFFKNSINGAIV